MSTTEVPEKVQSLIETIINATVGADDTAEAARKALAEMVEAQGTGSTAKNKPAAKVEIPADEPEGMSLGSETIKRPNGSLYHVRKLGLHDDVSVLREARDKKLPVMAYGCPGTGKTALIEAAYCLDGKSVHTVQGTGDTETADFIGSYTQTGGGTFEWNDGPLLKAMDEGSVLYIDEIALIDPKVMAVVYSVMDGRGELQVTQNPSRGTVTAQEGFYIAAACNPNAPGARLSEAILSRFVLQFEVTTDYALAKKLGVPQKMVNAAQNMMRKLEDGSVGFAWQLRELLAAKDIQSSFGEDFALRNMISVTPEIDRPVAQEVLSKTYGKNITELTVD